MDKEDVVQIYNGVLLSHKKTEEILPLTTSIHLKGIMLNEVSQKEKDQNCMASLILSLNDVIYSSRQLSSSFLTIHEINP